MNAKSAGISGNIGELGASRRWNETAVLFGTEEDPPALRRAFEDRLVEAYGIYPAGAAPQGGRGRVGGRFKAFLERFFFFFPRLSGENKNKMMSGVKNGLQRRQSKELGLWRSKRATKPTSSSICGKNLSFFDAKKPWVLPDQEHYSIGFEQEDNIAMALHVAGSSEGVDAGVVLKRCDFAVGQNLRHR